jgi:hypothetical protein
MRDGNNSHHAVSMAGKAMPMISKMKKMAEMSAIDIFLSCLIDIRDTGMKGIKLQYGEWFSNQKDAG